MTSIKVGAFSGCSSLTSINIPSGLTSIESGTFQNCISLTTIDLPNSITSIGGSAFEDCGLTSITIPKSVTTIGSRAFEYCEIPTVISNIEEPFEIYGKQTNERTFSNNTFMNASLIVPKGSVEKYKATKGWNDFSFIEEGSGSGNNTSNEKCEKPTISYQNGILMFHSATEGATYKYSITDSDIKTGSAQEVQLGVTYHISVYATKIGYEDSETATATLCWIDVDPKTEGISNGVANIRANTVLIQNHGGILTIEGIDNGTSVNVYNINGILIGSAISNNGFVTVNTNLPIGSPAIIKIGDKNIKIVVK